MQINFGIVAVRRNSDESSSSPFEMVHFCGYENRPTKADFDDLKRELSTDPEFGLVEQMKAGDIILVHASPTVVKMHANAAGGNGGSHGR